MWRKKIMNKKIVPNMIFEGLGFPIRLINVPMRKVFGEGIFDINFIALHKYVLKMLAMKPSPLTGGEIRFIMDYLEMSTREFARLLGVTHPAVLKWLKEESKMTPGTEIVLRLYILDHLKVTDKEFRKIYQTYKPESLSKKEHKDRPLEIEGSELLAC